MNLYNVYCQKMASLQLSHSFLLEKNDKNRCPPARSSVLFPTTIYHVRYFYLNLLIFLWSSVVRFQLTHISKF